MIKAIYFGTFFIGLYCTYYIGAMTALHIAVFNKDLSKLKELIKTSEIENINITNYLTSPPLILATQNGDLETVKTLIQAGAQTSVTDRSGRTALHWAASTGNIPIINCLLVAGAINKNKRIYSNYPTTYKNTL